MVTTPEEYPLWRTPQPIIVQRHQPHKYIYSLFEGMHLALDVFNSQAFLCMYARTMFCTGLARAALVTIALLLSQDDLRVVLRFLSFRRCGVTRCVSAVPCPSVSTASLTMRTRVSTSGFLRRPLGVTSKREPASQPTTYQCKYLCTPAAVLHKPSSFSINT